CPPPRAATWSRPAPACPAPDRRRPMYRQSEPAHSGAGWEGVPQAEFDSWPIESWVSIARRSRCSVNGDSTGPSGHLPLDADPGALWPSSLPDVVDAVAGLVARLGIFGIVVERLALVGPLLLAVVAGDHRVVARRLVGVGGHQGRPRRGAGAIAYGLAASGRILVECVERHSVGTG